MQKKITCYFPCVKSAIIHLVLQFTKIQGITSCFLMITRVFTQSDFQIRQNRTLDEKSTPDRVKRKESSGERPT